MGDHGNFWKIALGAVMSWLRNNRREVNNIFLIIIRIVIINGRENEKGMRESQEMPYS